MLIYFFVLIILWYLCYVPWISLQSNVSILSHFISYLFAFLVGINLIIQHIKDIIVSDDNQIVIKRRRQKSEPSVRPH